MLISDQNISSSFAEAYRTMRTNIHYSFNEKPGKLLLVTSSFPQEGKTTTAINLALTMAEAGQKVLLIDTDLRIPSVYKIFGHDRNKGLTNILIDVYNTNLAEGDLSQYGIGDLFHIINIQAKTGVLTISENEDFYQLSFANGCLTDIQWKTRPEGERLGHLLVESGKITSVQQVRALQRQSLSPERLGSILLNMNLISMQDLEGPIKLHLSGAWYRIRSLRKGRFSFKEESVACGLGNGWPFNGHGAGHIDSLENSWKIKLESDNLPFIEERISFYLQDTQVDNLKILNSGPVPSNPPELLDSRRMRELIGILKDRFDTIIFDSPPVHSVGDACIIAPNVDGVVLVVQVGRTNRKCVQKSKQQLEAVGARICGVILNRLDMKKDGYYYYGYYRYYHYGYYHQQKGEEN